MAGLDPTASFEFGIPKWKYDGQKKKKKKVDNTSKAVVFYNNENVGRRCRSLNKKLMHKAVPGRNEETADRDTLALRQLSDFTVHNYAIRRISKTVGRKNSHSLDSRGRCEQQTLCHCPSGALLQLDRQATGARRAVQTGTGPPDAAETSGGRRT